MDEASSTPAPPRPARFLTWALFVVLNATVAYVVKEALTESRILTPFARRVGGWLAANLPLAVWLIALVASLALTTLSFWVVLRHVGKRPSTGAPAVADRPPAAGSLSDREAVLRERYIKDVAHYVALRLKRSLHQARFLDLGIKHDAAALKTPWNYRDADESVSYENILDAFDQSERRLLLLGHPGAGKTTALLHIGSHLIKTAQTSASAPVPIIVNLSDFRLPSRGEGGIAARLGRGISEADAFDQNKRAFEDWLIREMTERSELDRSTAGQWLRDGRLAVLLDGLDEFNDERRAELAATLNAGFLRDHPTVAVVICSRINEYAVLQSNAESQLKLRRAVQLQPLSDEQVEDYLREAQAQGLLRALPNDPALRTLSRTPLTLSVLVLAYGGETPIGLEAGATLSDTRTQLFESYVARMLQRQARRAHGKVIDDLAANDVSVAHYCYPPESINRGLGWLALALSVRMRTAFSPSSLVQLLLVANNPVRQPLNFATVYVVLGAVMTAALCIVAVPIVPPTDGAVSVAIWMIAAMWILLPWAGAKEHGWMTGETVVFLAAFGALYLGFGLLVRVIAMALPPDVSAYALVPLILSVMILSLFGSERRTKDPAFVALLVATIAGIGLFAVLHAWPQTGDGGSTLMWTIGLVAPWLCVALGLAWKADFSDRATYGSAAALAGLGGYACLVTATIEDVRWWMVLAGLALAALAIVGGIARRGLILVIVIAPFAAAGGAIAAVPGALVGALGAGALLAAMERLLRVRGGWRIEPADDTEGEPLETVVLPSASSRLLPVADRWFAWLDKWALSRMAWTLLALTRRVPFRQKAFIGNTVDTFLLKEGQNELEFEFIHRLLRDYFALRALMPRLKSDPLRKLKTIRSLGYQGEAALDLLVELADEEEAPVRAAAISALAHIPSPDSTACFERKIGDQAREVRSALLRSAATLPRRYEASIVRRMEPLGDGSEIGAILDAFPGGGAPIFKPKSTRLSRRRVSAGLEGPGVAEDYVERMGEAAVDPLLLALKQGSSATQLAAIRYLATIEDDRTINAVLGQARSRNAEIRVAVAWHLADLPADGARETFELLLQDRDKRVRKTAEKALERNWRLHSARNRLHP